MAEILLKYKEERQAALDAAAQARSAGSRHSGTSNGPPGPQLRVQQRRSKVVKAKVDAELHREKVGVSIRASFQIQFSPWAASFLYATRKRA